jgi:hypothetical protein
VTQWQSLGLVTGVLNNLKKTGRWVCFWRFGGSFTTAFVRFLVGRTADPEEALPVLENKVLSLLKRLGNGG